MLQVEQLLFLFSFVFRVGAPLNLAVGVPISLPIAKLLSAVIHAKLGKHLQTAMRLPRPTLRLLLAPRMPRLDPLEQIAAPFDQTL